ncbi:MAG: hypothetical protein JWQ69_2904 [Pseudomonas sp.]|nr:hypothetical protein [Pseudomonas sp.]
MSVNERGSQVAQRHPVMRQQLGDLTCSLRWQSRQNVFQVSIWVMPVEFGRLDQAHQRRRAFATAQRSCEEPILAFMPSLAQAQLCEVGNYVHFACTWLHGCIGGRLSGAFLRISTQHNNWWFSVGSIHLYRSARSLRINIRRDFLGTKALSPPTATSKLTWL